MMRRARLTCFRTVVGSVSLVATSLVIVAACQPDLDSLSARYDEPLGGDSGTSTGGSKGSGGSTHSGGSDTDTGGAGTGGGEPSDTCFDEKRSANESDVDCGGPSDCDRCLLNEVCTVHSDCEVGYCKSNRCTEPSCNDGDKNGNETDEDCGGSCAPAQKCAETQFCKANKDCETSFCSDGVCTSHCLSGAKDGDETDQDCGGATCDKCETSKACKVGGDCETGICSNDKCVEPSCSDEIENQSETGVDCGGPCAGSSLTPKRCALNDGCKVASDCDSFVCSSQVCVADTAYSPNAVIDLLEDGDTKIALLQGRTGDWYGFHDSTTGSLQATNELIPGGRGSGSQFGFHSVGNGYTSWGAGIGFDLNSPNGTKGLYDASAYHGVTFWARALTSMPLKVLFPDGNTDKAGGTCQAASKCDLHYYKSVTLTTSWQKFAIDLSQPLANDGGGAQGLVAMDKLVSIQFRTNQGATFDYWIDDVILTP